MAGRAAITSVTATAFTIPTDAPESDGTLAWDATTIVVVEAAGGGCVGIGYSYADASSADLIRRVLAPVVTGREALGVSGCWVAMRAAVRNIGRAGIASHAISAVDTALWDLKARLLGVSLLDLLGASRDAVPVYGSGGFTSCSVAELEAQLSGWVASGIRRVKMKVGREPALDAGRVEAARRAIGDAELFVDANGAYTVRGALTQAERFAESGVTWLEEPVASADVEGLRFIRTRAPAGMEIAAGEYG
ncbi:MAG: enolase C-terminal domain-like protein, partial [Longimicrobiales bacterium]